MNYLIILTMTLAACTPVQEELSPYLSEWRPIPASVGPNEWITGWRVAEDTDFESLCAFSDGQLSVSLADVTWAPQRVSVLAVKTGDGAACVYPRDGALFDLIFEEGHEYDLQVFALAEPDVLVRFYFQDLLTKGLRWSRSSVSF